MASVGRQYADVITGIGAENVSLSVGYHDAAKFRSAGYENITTNATYGGGVVRQYNGFSFSRVFDAGHMGASTQPSPL